MEQTISNLYPGSLHNHTHYSNFRLRDAINRPDKLVEYAHELGHKVLAFTEHETISGWVEIEKYIDKYPDMKLIRGNEIYLCRNGLNASNFVKGVDKYYHFILLAKDREGARQIMELSTRAWMRSYIIGKMRRVPTYYQDLVDIIGASPGHVIASTACLGGALGTQLLKLKEGAQSEDKLKKWCLSMKKLFGADNFYLEMQPSNNSEQIYVNKKIIEYSKELDIPFIITNDAHYLKKEDLQLEEIFLRAQEGEREVLSFYECTYLMSDAQVRAFMQKQIGEENIETAYNNIQKIADICENYTLKKELKIPSLPWREFPPYSNEKIEYYCELMPNLREFLTSPFKSDNALVSAVIAGIESHIDLQNSDAYNELNLCLGDTWTSSQVNNAQWSAYFLNLQKTIDVCWDSGTVVGCGRGSGVGFLLLYCLDITQINPLKEKTKTFRFRFLNPDRVSVLDIDTDVSGLKRAQVLEGLRQFYGEDRVANVLTLKTEKAKSAIKAACRGLGIDVDIASYLASMIESDRGLQRTLAQTFYGDENEDMAPNKTFRFEMEHNYPDVWKVATAIEGLIVGIGQHAGGIIFVDEPFTNSTALMRAPDGTIMTQFELHTCEAVSLIKIDLLSVEAIDKIQTCLELLSEQGYIEQYPTLRETYEKSLGVYNIERISEEMWQLLTDHKIFSLFQMEGATGIQGIDQLEPTSVDDLSVLNSTIRLMAQEKGGEMPTEKLARFKKNPHLWIEETEQYGLTDKEREVLWPILSTSYGLCITQEQFMQLVQLPELGGFNLTWADKLRKSIAKKNPKEFNNLTEEFYKVTAEKGISERFTHYVWDVLISMSKGYGFNASHTLAYSLIALQEMNLAYKNPSIFWTCACLITDSGSTASNEDDDEDINVYEEIEEEQAEIEGETVDIFELEDSDEYEYIDAPDRKTKVKKKVHTADYGKIAKAIGRAQVEGVDVSTPDINHSLYTFYPDVEHNRINYGLRGITRISEDLIKNIIANRPYTSVKDFLSKVKVNKVQMINLIKSNIFSEFGDVVQIMNEYIDSIADIKKVLNLRNLQLLITLNLFPSEYSDYIKIFNFNKFLKKNADNDFYNLSSYAYNFYESHFDIDILVPGETESGFKISQVKWDKIYDKYKDIFRKYISDHQAELLTQVNTIARADVVEKYAQGTVEKWAMDALSFYPKNHELDYVDLSEYDVYDWDDLPEQPEVEMVFKKDGRNIPIFRIRRIAGTVLEKNKTKHTVTLLTTNGVVTVKLYGDAFTNYDRQISEVGADGKKHVKEKGFLQRGNKIIVTGIRTGESDFLAKKYKKTPYHLIELIKNINGSQVEIQSERMEV